MNALQLEALATAENFDESAYLLCNPDVKAAVAKGELKSGRQHWEIFGRNEQRKLRSPGPELVAAKRQKLPRIVPLLRTDLPCVRTVDYHDFLTPELRAQYDIIDTDAVSGHPYDSNVRDLIARHAHGWVLDCGAGRRPTYYTNVVNFEIVAYDTTDVRGVGEVLPFQDNAFDAVVSNSVLEHVKDPFQCAHEIARVLKPGGDLFCSVPFLQPLHGYPHHYYNMTHQGLINLFSSELEIDRVEVPDWVLPIFALTWIAQSWAAGLQGGARDEFMQLKISDLLQTGDKYLGRRFVRELSTAKNLELACGTALFAHKKG